MKDLTAWLQLYSSDCSSLSLPSHFISHVIPFHQFIWQSIGLTNEGDTDIRTNYFFENWHHLRDRSHIVQNSTSNESIFNFWMFLQVHQIIVFTYFPSIALRLLFKAYEKASESQYSICDRRKKTANQKWIRFI